MKNLLSSYSFLLGCLLFFLLTSCDPGQSIRIENKTEAEASIQFVFQGDDREYHFEEQTELTNSDTLTIRLAPANQNAVKEFHFGIGHWKIQYSMDKLVEMVESITIETTTSKEVFKGKQQIRAFFEKRISGSKDEIIQIILE